MVVLVDRVYERIVVRDALGQRPAEIPTARDNIDFLPGTLANIVDVQFVGPRFHLSRERISKAVGPDLWSGATLIDVRIVRRDQACRDCWVECRSVKP